MASAAGRWRAGLSLVAAFTLVAAGCASTNPAVMESNALAALEAGDGAAASGYYLEAASAKQANDPGKSAELRARAVGALLQGGPKGLQQAEKLAASFEDPRTASLAWVAIGNVRGTEGDEPAVEAGARAALLKALNLDPAGPGGERALAILATRLVPEDLDGASGGLAPAVQNLLAGTILDAVGSKEAALEAYGAYLSAIPAGSVSKFAVNAFLAAEQLPQDILYAAARVPANETGALNTSLSYAMRLVIAMEGEDGLDRRMAGLSGTELASATLIRLTLEGKEAEARAFLAAHPELGTSEVARGSDMEERSLERVNPLLEKLASDPRDRRSLEDLVDILGGSTGLPEDVDAVRLSKILGDALRSLEKSGMADKTLRTNAAQLRLRAQLEAKQYEDMAATLAVLYDSQSTRNMHLAGILINAGQTDRAREILEKVAAGTDESAKRAREMLQADQRQLPEGGSVE